MKKDIFIDTDFAVKKLTNPMSPSCLSFYQWLITKNSNPTHDAFLVLSLKLIREYSDSCGIYPSLRTGMSVIFDIVTKENRINRVENSQIKDFKKNHYKSKRLTGRLRCNKNDACFHLPTVMLSDRKYALSLDNNFSHDLNNFPGYTAIAENDPSLIPYP